MAYDDSNEQTKTVYAHFGAAIYFAQCLEHGLVNALVYLDLIPTTAHGVRNREEWAVAVDAFMDRHFEHTLGRMIRNLSKVVEVRDDLPTVLQSALDTRNWLAHDYFRERAVEFVSDSGRDRMIAELEAAQQLFRDAGARLDATFKPVRERYGLSDERLEQACEQLLSESKSMG